MKYYFHRFSGLIILYLFNSLFVSAQNSFNQFVSNSNYQQVNTYVNPVLPGDHPDPTLLKVGDNFYHCGYSFHFTPYLPIYHSKDLVHWKVISRVVPSAGIWQGPLLIFMALIGFIFHLTANGFPELHHLWDHGLRLYK